MGVFFRARDPTVVRRLSRHVEWRGPAEIGLTDAVLVFDGDPTRRTSLRTVESVVRRDEVVWVRRRRAHDWLIRCASERDAVRLAEAVRAGAGVV